jgi:hypothetical protein
MSINTEFQNELINAVNNYDEIRQLNEQIAIGAKYTPLGKSVLFYNDKEFATEAEFNAYYEALYPKDEEKKYHEELKSDE